MVWREFRSEAESMEGSWMERKEERMGIRGARLRARCGRGEDTEEEEEEEEEDA